MNIILHDKRIKGATPKTNSENIAVNVDETNSLDSILAATVLMNNQFGFVWEIVKIWAHGKVKEGRGGRGVTFGKDDIILSNISKFSLLKGKAKFIDFYTCKMADVQPGMEGKNEEGNGRFLCSQIAIYSGAIVTASTNTQTYSKDDATKWYHIEKTIDFGKWDGSVLFFLPDGRIIESWGQLQKILAGR